MRAACAGAIRLAIGTLALLSAPTATAMSSTAAGGRIAAAVVGGAPPRPPRRGLAAAVGEAKVVSDSRECADVASDPKLQPPRDGVVRPCSSEGASSAPTCRQALLPTSSVEHHASALVLIEHPDQWELLCAWFSGVEGSETVSIFMSRMEEGSGVWSQPEELAREPGASLQNPVWLWDRESSGYGMLRLLYTRQTGHDQGTSNVKEIISLDRGHSWEEGDRTLFTNHGPFIKNKIIPGSRPGEWLLPMYYTPLGASPREIDSQYSTLRRSVDDGETWDKEVKLSELGSGLVQPSIVRLHNGKLVAFFRQRYSGEEGMNYVWRSESDDDGHSWTEPSATSLPNPNKAVQAIVLQSGAVLIIFNNNHGNVKRERGEDGKRRIVDTRHYPISAGLSYDGGLTWPFVRDLEEEYFKNLEYSYPSVEQAPDGSIHITYTWSQPPCRRLAIRYMQVDEEWVTGQWEWGATRGIYLPDASLQVRARALAIAWSKEPAAWGLPRGMSVMAIIVLASLLVFYCQRRKAPQPVKFWV